MGTTRRRYNQRASFLDAVISGALIPVTCSCFAVKVFAIFEEFEDSDGRFRRAEGQ